jgi:membrane-bound ClpP family serine protease
MWEIAGVLLGLTVLAGLVGFHTGPHAHAVAGIIGLLAAVWLVVMVVEGRSAPVLWALLSADVVLSVAIGLVAWKGLSSSVTSELEHHHGVAEGADALAVSELAPDGVVLVHGEQWSAVSLNGDVPAGARVHVVRTTGVRLEVWRDDVEPGGDLFSLDARDEDEVKGLNGPSSSSSSSSQASPLSPSAPSGATDAAEKEPGS